MLQESTHKGNVYNDTWEYDPLMNNWSMIDTDYSPSAMIYANMVYSQKDQKILLFGGGLGDSGQSKNDTWIFNCNTNQWIEMNAEISPKPSQS